jgi:hypothetical protein
VSTAVGAGWGLLKVSDKKEADSDKKEADSDKKEADSDKKEKG